MAYNHLIYKPQICWLELFITFKNQNFVQYFSTFSLSFS